MSGAKSQTPVIWALRTLKQEDWIWGQTRLQLIIRSVSEKKKNLKVSINIRINKQNVIHTNNGIWFSLISEEILACDSWMDHEDLTRREKRVTRDSYCMFPLTGDIIVTKYINIEGGCQGQVRGVGRSGDHYSTAPKSFTTPSKVWVWEAEALWSMVTKAVQQCEFP